MLTVKSNDLWNELSCLAQSSVNIKAAVAYVSDDSIISFKTGDTLVVDASENSISSGRTSAKVLKTAYLKGAKLYSCDSLHSKVIVFYHHAYIGSANISSNSVNNLNEIGIITDHPKALSGAIDIINQLIEQSKKIDADYIEHISSLSVNNMYNKTTKPRVISKNIFTTWLISIRNDIIYGGDENEVEKHKKQIIANKNEEKSWFFLKSGSNFFENAKIGDSVILIERETKYDKPQKVYRHVIIKDITSKSNKDIKEYYFSYTDNHLITWSSFKKLAEKVKITKLGSGLSTIRKISDIQSNTLFELWHS